jgi:hypothetical protein
MPFITRFGPGTVLGLTLALANPLSQLVHAPIYSEPDLVGARANAATNTGSVVGAVSHQIAYAGFSCGMATPPRNVPNFPTANSLATIDKLTVTECASNTGGVTRTGLADIVTPTWQAENIRHVHDLAWRTWWLSIQRFAGSSSARISSTGTKMKTTDV